jgi:hypothetical protein
MTGVDLVAEYRQAQGAVRGDDLASLILAGVTIDGIALARPALATIAVEGDIFVPDPDGVPAFVLPIRAYGPLSPEAPEPRETLHNGSIIDLCAIHPERPGCFALRRGVAEWLGCCAPQFLNPDPVRVWRTALSWLQAGCDGLVLLSRDRRDQYRVLSSLNAIIAEDEVHAAELRAVLARPWPAPPVLAAEGGRHAA